MILLNEVFSHFYLYSLVDLIFTLEGNLYFCLLAPISPFYRGIFIFLVFLFLWDFFNGLSRLLWIFTHHRKFILVDISLHAVTFFTRSLMLI